MIKRTIKRVVRWLDVSRNCDQLIMVVSYIGLSILIGVCSHSWFYGLFAIPLFVLFLAGAALAMVVIATPVILVAVYVPMGWHALKEWAYKD
jgi:hypothetical protein